MSGKEMKAGILTISDKGSRNERIDESGPAVRELLTGIGVAVEKYEIIPDEKDVIEQKLISYSDNIKLDIIVTTGGTGVSPRDLTPDATLAVIDREIPGFAEAMRMESFKKTPHALISRAVAGVRGNTLIINLPGSPKGARENLEIVLKAIPHTVSKLQGDPADCAAQ
jgi:molybdopterin adenylyltransferase